MTPRRLTLFELNEYNVGLLRQGASVFNLSNLKKILALNELETRMDDTYESDYLEPWSQWVSVHTGSPSQQHKIKHLGDVPSLGRKQLWEELSEKGITSGIWGAMNASRGQASHCLFFLPDPWTYSEPGFPVQIKKMLQLPRYLAKNYGQLSALKILKYVPAFLTALLSPPILVRLLKELPSFCSSLIRYKGAHFVYICFADLVLSDVFLVFKKKYDPQFSVIFLNSLAHTQHHHWVKEDISQNDKLKYCLINIDKIFGRFLKELESEALIVFNGLSQKNTAQEPSWNLYRQFDQMTFLRAMNLNPTKVESLMTHDAHVFFETQAQAQSAYKILSDIRIEQQPLFLVEIYKEDPLRLFYRLVFTDEVSMDAHFVCSGVPHRFGDHFSKIVQRTGKHIPLATAFTNLKPQVSPVYNHDIYDLVVDFFERSQSRSSGQLS